VKTFGKGPRQSAAATRTHTTAGETKNCREGKTEIFLNGSSWRFQFAIIRPDYQNQDRMNATHLFPLAFVVSLATWMIPILGFATSVSTATIEQPINLGAKSDPARIPLGRVIVLCNYYYGLHRMINEPRPCPDGAMQWKGGSELDQNLASVFGISVEVEDPTQLLAAPVVLRVKSWKPPGYSPYTKDQVLAATLWCLLRSVSGTSEHPLDIRILAEGMDDKALVEKYSGKYVTAPGRDGKKVPPVKLPGSKVEVDGRGNASVVFSELSGKASSPAPSPAMILGEDSEDGESDPGWSLLPIWGNDDGSPLRYCAWSASICYSAWHSSGRKEANSFLAAGGSHYFDVFEDKKGDSVLIGITHVPESTLAAQILALVITAQPTEARPLTVTIRLEEYGLATYPAFRSASGWKETRHGAHNITLECEFVWDADALKLVKGSVPLVEVDHAFRHIVMTPVPAPEPGADENLAKVVRDRIRSGIHNGNLLVEKNMASDMLAESGLRRQIGLAGYYEALATFYREEG